MIKIILYQLVYKTQGSRKLTFKNFFQDFKFFGTRKISQLFKKEILDFDVFEEIKSIEPEERADFLLKIKNKFSGSKIFAILICIKSVQTISNLFHTLHLTPNTFFCLPTQCLFSLLILPLTSSFPSKFLRLSQLSYSQNSWINIPNTMVKTKIGSTKPTLMD